MSLQDGDADLRYAVLDWVIEDNYALIEIRGTAPLDRLRDAIAALAHEGLVEVGRYGELDGRVVPREPQIEIDAVLADDRSWDPERAGDYDERIAIAITEKGKSEYARLSREREP